MPTSAWSRRRGRRARAVASASIALLIAAFDLVWSPKKFLSKEGGGSASIYNNCMALELHEQGHWQHHYHNMSSDMDKVLNATSIAAQYLPAEIEWLAGKNLPDRWDVCASGIWMGERIEGLMYQTGLGNQGRCRMCGVRGFQPSFSKWKIPANDAISDTNDNNSETRGSPSLRLIERLAKANSTLCFLGDSIDFQIYDALRNNLFRQQRLQEEITIKIETREIPVNYSSAGWEPPYHHFMTMERILQTVVSLQYRHDESRVLNTTIRYFQMYGWSPWNTAFTEDCNVLILCIALHYDARGDMLGKYWGRPKLMDDIQGAITYLVDFVSTSSTAENRIAVWR